MTAPQRLTEEPNLFRDGQAYERMMGRWSHLVGEKFLDWLDAPAGLRWIDVGCGNGAFTEVLIARCAPAAVMGIDPSDQQIAYARERQSVKLARFRVAHAQSLPFPDNSFDAAAMALVISFLTDPLTAAKEMARVVKPGGIDRHLYVGHSGRRVAGQSYLCRFEGAGARRPAAGRRAPFQSRRHGTDLATGRYADRSRPRSSAFRSPIPTSTISGNRATCRSAHPAMRLPICRRKTAKS